MLQTLMTLTIVVVVTAASAWYFIGMPGLETAMATIPDVTGSAAPATP